MEEERGFDHSQHIMDGMEQHWDDFDQAKSFDMEDILNSIVLSWGRNDTGTLLGTADSETVDGVQCFDNKRRVIRQISSNAYHTACLTQTGEIIMCGSDQEGQTANDAESASLPKRPRVNERLNNQRILSVSCGLYHTLCVSSTGSVIAFGGNEAGQCGHSAGKLIAKPAKVDFRCNEGKAPIIVTHACSGDLFSLFLTTTGEVYACGLASNLGHAAESDSIVAQRVDSLLGSHIVAIAAGSSHALALSASGELFTWGSNQHGQLGLGSDGVSASNQQIPRLVPIPPGTGKIIGIDAGSSHSLIWTNTGQILGCGSNKYGQIGLVSIPRSYDFQLIESIDNVVMAACGQNHSIVLTTGTRDESMASRRNHVIGFGANNFGQLKSSSTATMYREHVEISEAYFGGAVGEVMYISAGGDQSFAIGSHSPLVPLDAIMKKKFSTQASRATRAMSARELQDLLTRTQADSRLVSSTLFTITELFSSPSLLAGSFLEASSDDRSSVGTDFTGLEECYVALLQLGNAGVVRLTGAIQMALGDLEKIISPSTSSSSEASIPASVVHVLATLWLCPINSNAALSIDIFPRLAILLSHLPEMLHRSVVMSVAQLPPHIFASRLLKPLQEHVMQAMEIFSSTNNSSALSALCDMLRSLYELNRSSQLVPPEVFYNSELSGLPDRYLLRDYGMLQHITQQRATASQQGVGAVVPAQQPFLVCNYPFLLSADAKRRIVLAESAIQQHTAQQRSILQGFLRQQSVPWLVLRIERDHLLQHALVQIAHASDLDLKKPLKVVFEGEEGIDEGGVKKEFFQLLTAQLFSSDYGMFVPTPDQRAIWLNRNCTWGADEFSLVGILLGLAVYNGVLLDVHLPKVFYKKLLQLPVELDDLGSIDPELHQGLKQLIDYKPAADVEHVFCRTMEAEWDSFGERQVVELIPGGAEVAVTGENRREYVDKLLHWYINESVNTQFQQLFTGFSRVVPHGSLQLMTPTELELLMVGQPHLDFKDLERSTEYIGESDWGPSHATICAFWEVVHELPFEDKQKLLLFVTGSKKAPIGGLSRLGLKIQRMGPDSSSLPTSHTCFNTLLLPEYATKTKMRDRLLKAISECEGFGLK